MRTSVVVIGAGQCGLAMSWWLAQRGIEHVVLERGEVANSWAKERWDSLRLLTPNWQSRLPGYVYDGPTPEGYLDRAQTVDFLRRYAHDIAAPVRTHSRVTALRREADDYLVVTERATWRCHAVVIASGAFNLPSLPAVAQQVPPGVRSLHSMEYRNPNQLEQAGVLVVGAAATGAQIADEIQRSGRPVTLAVGEHVRVPRRYRGKDILWWLDASGVLDERYDQVDDLTRARHVASFQLAGYADQRSIDLNTLAALGVRKVGRLVGFNDGKAQFSGSLRNVCALADLKMNRLLNSIDEWISAQGLDAQTPAPERYAMTEVEDSPPLLLDLARQNINTILWATGYGPDYSWLQLPLLDRKGHLVHEGGVVNDSPGLYLLGAPFLRRRKSSLIDGAGQDACDISALVLEHLEALAARRTAALSQS